MTNCRISYIPDIIQRRHLKLNTVAKFKKLSNCFHSLTRVLLSSRLTTMKYSLWFLNILYGSLFVCSVYSFRDKPSKSTSAFSTSCIKTNRNTLLDGSKIKAILFEGESYLKVLELIYGNGNNFLISVEFYELNHCVRVQVIYLNDIENISYFLISKIAASTN